MTQSAKVKSRDLKYLRLSITDRCNLRCCYCMSPSGVTDVGHTGVMSFEGYIEIIEALVPLGLEKVRITGGEPLVRKGVVDFVKALKGVPGIQTIAMTTNGELLSEYARALRLAGLDRVNLSLDAVDQDVYKRVTRCGNIEKALRGLKAAIDEGLTPVKINMVYIKGVNDDQVEALMNLTGPQVSLRLIELMPIGEAAAWSRSHFAPVEDVLKARGDLRREVKADSGVARYYHYDKTGGLVGVITPISDHFCNTCDKVRITSDGMLRTCLHSDAEVDLRPYLGLMDGGEGIRRVVLKALKEKPLQHQLNQGQSVLRNMSSMGG